MNLTALLVPVAFIMALQLPPHISLVIGVFVSLFLLKDQVLQNKAKRFASNLLQLSIVLLGPSLNFNQVLESGLSGTIVTLVSIVFVMICGFVLAKLYRISSPVSHLISSGTAICGGSAIGAVAPILKADQFSIAVSMAIVFILNAVAILLFPPIGEMLSLTQDQFGTWAALAIHDTSAVVAAGSAYGERALEVATTLKLTRALWIIPLSLVFSWLVKTKSSLTAPWFILLFLAGSILFTSVENLTFLTPYLKIMSKTGFSLTLFLIGVGLQMSQLKTVKLNLLLYGITLWLITLSISLLYVKNFV